MCAGCGLGDGVGGVGTCLWVVGRWVMERVRLSVAEIPKRDGLTRSACDRINRISDCA